MTVAKSITLPKNLTEWATALVLGVVVLLAGWTLRAYGEVAKASPIAEATLSGRIDTLQVKVEHNSQQLTRIENRLDEVLKRLPSQ